MKGCSLDLEIDRKHNKASHVFHGIYIVVWKSVDQMSFALGCDCGNSVILGVRHRFLRLLI